jgi:hypothetical protein
VPTAFISRRGHSFSIQIALVSVVLLYGGVFGLLRVISMIAPLHHPALKGALP